MKYPQSEREIENEPKLSDKKEAKHVFQRWTLSENIQI